MQHSESIDIRYLGFHPSEWTRMYLDDALSSLGQQLPFGAQIRAVIKRQDDMLVANVDILSRWGRCFVPARSNRLKDLCDQLEERVHRHTNKWRDRQRKRRSAS